MTGEKSTLTILFYFIASLQCVPLMIKGSSVCLGLQSRTALEC